MLSLRRLERHMKGAASRRRIAILLLLETKPGLSLLEIAEQLKWNIKTTAEHVRRLALAGLISKGHHTSFVPHKLTPRGRQVLQFLRKLE